MPCAQYFKGIMFELERFMRKAKPDQKIPAFYLINAVCQASRNKFKDKDSYVDRFVEKGQPAIETLNECSDQDKKKVEKVLKFWIAERIFPENWVFKMAGILNLRVEDDSVKAPSIEEQMRLREEELAQRKIQRIVEVPPPGQQQQLLPQPGQQQPPFFDPRRGGPPPPGGSNLEGLGDVRLGFFGTSTCLTPTTLTLLPSES